MLEKIDDWLCDHSKLYLWLYRFVYHGLYYPLRYRFKYFLQRVFRGWSDDEAWDLRSHITKRFIRPLKHMRKNMHSYPYGLTPEEWEDILDKIIFAFELEIEEEEDFKEYKDNATYAKQQEGYELLGKWFKNLWD